MVQLPVATAVLHVQLLPRVVAIDFIVENANAVFCGLLIMTCNLALQHASILFVRVVISAALPVLLSVLQLMYIAAIRAMYCISTDTLPPPPSLNAELIHVLKP